SGLLAPVLSLESTDPQSGLFDDNGEMLLATLRFYNPNNFAPEHLLFTDTEAIEARVSNRWIRIPRGWSKEEGRWIIYQGTTSSKMILLPAGADRCRVSLRFAGTSVPFRARLNYFLGNKLGRRQDLLPPKFWAWAWRGYKYSPSAPW